MLSLYILFALITLSSAATTYAPFGVIDNPQCSAIGYFVQAIAFAAGDSANNLVSIGNGWSNTPPAFTNVEYFHMSLCVTQDDDGNNEYLFSQRFANSSIMPFDGSDCGGAYFGTMTFLIVQKYNATGVVSSLLGIPIQGAVVSAQTANGTTSYVTGSDGSYNLPLSNGVSTLYVSADGYIPTTVTVNVNSSNIATNIVLTPKPIAINVTVSFDGSILDTLLLQLSCSIDPLCNIIEGFPPCDCSPSVFSSTSSGKELILSNAVGCDQPSVFAIYSSILANSGDVIVVVSQTVDGSTTTIGTYVKNTSSFLGYYWRLCSVSPGGAIYVFNDVVSSL